jgi:Predicted membrane protein
MTKYEYIHRLRQYLADYTGNIEEIIQNYTNIIEEMLDEGLTMDEVSQRLGTPGSLCEEIVQEFNLEYRKKVGLPTWAKVALIICAIFFAFPIFGLLLGLIATIFGLFVAIIGIIIGLFTASIAIWAVPTISILFKVVFGVFSLSSMVATGVILFYIGYGICCSILWVVKSIGNLFKQSFGGYVR